MSWCLQLRINVGALGTGKIAESACPDWFLDNAGDEWTPTAHSGPKNGRDAARRWRSTRSTGYLSFPHAYVFNDGSER